MRKQELLNKLKEKILVLDGAMGTVLQQKGFTEGCPDELNIKKPELIKSIHKEYVDSGSDIIITNTFGANRVKLKQYGLEDKIIGINGVAVEIAKEAANGQALVAGDIGPLGRYIEPLDELTFDEVYDIFSEQVKALREADLILIETISDIKVLKAAILATKDNCDLPIIASGTFENNRTTTGTDAETFAVVADSLGADIIGANCSGGPKELYGVAKIFVKTINKPIVIQPNAGIPRLEGGKAEFSVRPKELGEWTKKFVDLGVNIVGGCCGTTPEHIKEIAKNVKDLKLRKIEVGPKTSLCSRTKTVIIGGKTLIVGERINPTGRKNLTEEIKQGKTNLIRKEALEQVSEGASLLDINVGVAGVDQSKILKKTINDVQNVVDVPLVIDTSDVKALEIALKQSDGRALINSVNGKKESLETVLPLAKRYGAAIIALTLDDEGIPQTKEKRIEVAKKIIDEALKIGIKKEDIIVDCLTLTIATNPENEKIILKAVKEIKELGYKTILGVSNISHGLPARTELNSKFFTKASRAGLDLAILNPLHNIEQLDTEIKIGTVEIKKEDYKDLSIEKQLHNAITYGDKENVTEIIENALKKLKAMEINDILIRAINKVGENFSGKKVFLPQVLLSAAAMKKAFERLKEELKKEGGGAKGKILFATVKGDIHDIGKNIVIALLESHNFEIVDLGKDVNREDIIKAVKKYDAHLVALSALMTTTAVEMENVIKELRDNDVKIPVIIGGAVITDEYAKKIQANYAKDALEAVKVIEQILKSYDKNNRSIK